MRIIKCEKIFLSQNEVDIWSNFYILLKDLERDCENRDTIKLLQEIQARLDDLWEEVEGVE